MRKDVVNYLRTTAPREHSEALTNLKIAVLGVDSSDALWEDYLHRMSRDGEDAETVLLQGTAWYYNININVVVLNASGGGVSAFETRFESGGHAELTIANESGKIAHSDYFPKWLGSFFNSKSPLFVDFNWQL